MGRVISIIHFADYDADLVRDTTIAPEPIIAQFDYTYNDAGQRLSAVENFDTDSDGDFDITHEFDWDYDALARLIEEIHDGTGTGSGDDYTTTYSFDLVGNRVSMTTDSSDAAKDRTVTYTYDDNDRLLTETSDAVTGDDTHTIYSWGNATGTVGGTATQQTGKRVWESLDTSGDVLETVTYAYNLQGRLGQATFVKGSDTTVLDYIYDDSGIRVSQTETVNAGTPVVTQYLVDHDNHTGYQQVLEEFIDALLAKSYTIGLDVLAQTNADTTPDTYQFLYDAHGSTRALLTALAAIAENPAAGDALQLFTYDAYGNALAFDTAAALTTLLYSGEQFDQKLAMQYLRARYYDAGTGRFNRVDPFVGDPSMPSSLHKYSYAGVNPIGYIDPSGEILAVVELLGQALQAGLRWSGHAISAYGGVVATNAAISVAVGIILRGVLHQDAFSVAEIFKDAFAGAIGGAAAKGISILAKAGMPMANFALTHGRGALLGMIGVTLSHAGGVLVGQPFNFDQYAKEAVIGMFIGAGFQLLGAGMGTVGKYLLLGGKHTNVSLVDAISDAAAEIARLSRKLPGVPLSKIVTQHVRNKYHRLQSTTAHKQWLEQVHWFATKLQSLESSGILGAADDVAHRVATAEWYAG